MTKTNASSWSIHILETRALQIKGLLSEARMHLWSLAYYPNFLTRAEAEASDVANQMRALADEIETAIAEAKKVPHEQAA